MNRLRSPPITTNKIESCFIGQRCSKQVPGVMKFQKLEEMLELHKAPARRSAQGDHQSGDLRGGILRGAAFFEAASFEAA
jgi:hypothetical protein